jgi:anti-sigma B factor antagonist
MTSGADASDSPEPDPASFAVRRHDLDRRTCVLAIKGELDIASAPQLKQELNEPLAAGCRRLVLDLAQVNFIDSTALGVLVSVNYERRLVAGEGLVMAGLRPSVLKVFEVTGLLSSFDTTSDVETALSRVRDEAAEPD